MNSIQQVFLSSATLSLGIPPSAAAVLTPLLSQTTFVLDCSILGCIVIVFLTYLVMALRGIKWNSSSTITSSMCRAPVQQSASHELLATAHEQNQLKQHSRTGICNDDDPTYNDDDNSDPPVFTSPTSISITNVGSSANAFPVLSAADPDEASLLLADNDGKCNSTFEIENMEKDSPTRGGQDDDDDDEGESFDDSFDDSVTTASSNTSTSYIDEDQQPQQPSGGVRPGEKRSLLVLVSIGVVDRTQSSNQRRALFLLDAREVPYETIDGMDPSQREIRNGLFDLAGLDSVSYPQFFFVGDGTISYVGNYQRLESLNEASDIPKEVLTDNPDIETWETVFEHVVDPSVICGSGMY